MSYDLCCAHPPSTTNFFFAVLVCPRFVCLSSQHSLDWHQPHSFFQLSTLAHCCQFLPRDRYCLFQKLVYVLLCKPLSCPPLPAPHTSKCGTAAFLMPRSRISHITAPANRFTCLRTCTSKICYLHAFCCSLPRLPIHTPSAQQSVAMVEMFLNIQIIGERDWLFLACCCCHLPPQLQAFCWCDAHCLTSPRSRKDQADSQQLPHPSPPDHSGKGRISHRTSSSSPSLFPSSCFVAFPELLFQVTARSDHFVFPSFPPPVTDNFNPLTLLSCFFF